VDNGLADIGINDGPPVGAPVGPALGIVVGTAVGDVVGNCKGSVLGIKVGKYDGFIDNGLNDGDPVRAFVGEFEGESEGVRVTQKNRLLPQLNSPPLIKSFIVEQRQPTPCLTLLSLDFQLLHVFPALVVQSVLSPVAWLLQESMTEWFSGKTIRPFTSVLPI
jgi:hypothetical protein